MFVLIGAVLGALWGGALARRRGGKKADMAQYAAGFGILFALVGLIFTLVIHRAFV